MLENGWTLDIILIMGVMVSLNKVTFGSLLNTVESVKMECTIRLNNWIFVPAALLETKNKYRIIIAQLPIASTLLITHIALMYFGTF